MFVPMYDGRPIADHARMSVGEIDVDVTIEVAAENALFDRACRLVTAAEQLQAAADRRGSAAGIAATLGAIDASLEALREAVALLGPDVSARLTRATPQSGGRHEAVGTVRRDFAALETALSEAHLSADEMRERVGPLVARLTL
jgi:hypothetical protein